jgi:AcrR family transcriptional regulator
MTSTTVSGRARPLPPDERREAIVRAAVPLLRREGASATTRQIAQAAGVAEGTLFRVFKDKEAIIDAVVEHALDPGTVVAAIRAVPRDLELEPKLLRIVTLLQQRIADVIELMVVIARTAPTRFDPRRRAPEDPTVDPAVEAVHEVLAPDADRFRLDLPEVTRLIRLLVFAGTHPWITESRPLTPEQIVEVVLDGVRRRDVTPAVVPTDDAAPAAR